MESWFFPTQFNIKSVWKHVCPSDGTLQLSQTKKTVIVDVIIVNSIIGLKGWERVERWSDSRGGAVATRQGTRVDRNSAPKHWTST
jgi:hypothetical protein